MDVVVTGDDSAAEEEGRVELLLLLVLMVFTVIAGCVDTGVEFFEVVVDVIGDSTAAAVWT